MAMVLQICTRALRRLGVIDGLHSPSAEEAADAIAALNEMLYGWKARGVDLLLQEEFAAAGTFRFWVPPVDLTSAVIGALSYRSAWNASTNSPALASATGTLGDVYRVTVSGSTTLDDVSSWSVDDFAVFNGVEWLKGISSQQFDGTCVAMLALRCADEYGVAPPATVVADARDGWATIQSYYVKPPTAGFDKALTDVPSRTLTVAFEDG